MTVEFWNGLQTCMYTIILKYPTSRLWGHFIFAMVELVSAVMG